MITIELSPEEYRAGAPSAAHLDEALHAIRADGFVVLHGAVAPDHVAALREQMTADVHAYLARYPDRDHKHINIAPPPMMGYLFEDVIANPFALAICRALWGTDVSNGFYRSNSNLPGTPEQPLHVDSSPRKPGDLVRGPCNTVVVNVPLIDFTVENGATEVWPGTHMVPCEIGSRWVTDAQQERQRTVRPPERAVMPAGSVLVRDIRLWHRGPANHGDCIRTMVAMIWNQFQPGRDKPADISPLGTFPPEARPFFQELSIKTNPRYAEGEFDYIGEPMWK